MPPFPTLSHNADPSDAFFHQFSTIIRHESRLHGDRSEDVAGPGRQRWVVRHLNEVARAQRFNSQRPAQTTTMNVHAPEFITPPPAQATTSRRSEHIIPPPAPATTFSGPEHLIPWYNNFNLADQGVGYYSTYQAPTALSSDFPHPLSQSGPFNPHEVAEPRAVIREQLVHSSNQLAENQYSAPLGNFSQNSVSFRRPNHNPPYSQPPTTPPNNFPPQYQPPTSSPNNFPPQYQPPTTPPNNFPRARYPSTPPNRLPRYRSHISPPESLFVVNTTPRASTEPIAQSARMGTLIAPDHYKPVEIYALEVRIGDFIQSVKNPGTQAFKEHPPPPLFLFSSLFFPFPSPPHPPPRNIPTNPIPNRRSTRPLPLRDRRPPAHRPSRRRRPPRQPQLGPPRSIQGRRRHHPHQGV